MPLIALHAQTSLQSNIWYFGNHAGLDFNSGVPVPVTNGALSTFEGTASIADKVTGQILFYTDGDTIYDATHNVMLNGAGLLGHNSATQSGVIVPDPGNANRYYVFTVGAQAGYLGSYGGIAYSIVDMTLNGGLGAVSTLNVQLVNPASEKITAVRHCNGRDVWVITHQWNSNAFYTYLVTPTGVQLPVISNAGIIHQNIGSTNNSESIGYMKVAPDQQHLGLCTFHPMNVIQLFDFDNVLGTVSNANTIQMPVIGNYGGPYGCSFSPDGSKFYAAYHNYAGTPNYVFQYDMNAGSPAAVVASQTVVASTSAVSYGALQLASDGKMYMAAFNNAIGGPFGSPTVDRFNNPNALGLASGYVANAVFLGGGFSVWGLPDYIESFFSPPVATNFNDTTICTGATVNFNPVYGIVMDSITWDFDDPISGALNYSNLNAPSHGFNTAGIYHVHLIVHYNCHHDTITSDVTVNDLPIFLGNDTTICIGQNLTLNPNYPGALYQWSNGTTNQTISVSSPGGTYWLQVTDGLCIAHDTINVTFNPPPIVTLGNDTTICNNQTLVLNAGNPGSAFLWSNGATTQTIVVSATGNYWAVADITGCIDKDTILVTVNQPPAVSLGNDTVLCNGQALQLNANALGYTNQWSNGSTGTSISVNTSGSYWVQLDDGICNVSDTIIIQFNPPPVVNLGNDTAVCNNASVFLDAGNTGSSFLWNTGATTQTISTSTPGSYIVTVDLTGCIDKDTMQLFVVIPPAVFLGNDTTLCQGEQITLSTSEPGYSNLWSTGSTSNTIQVTVTGNYSIQLDNGICHTSDSINVFFDIPPLVNLGNDTILCQGQILQLDAGIPGALYLWNTGAVSQIISVNNAGMYAVNVTLGACLRTDSMNVNYSQPLPVLLGNDTTLCQGQAVTLTTPLNGYTYLWSNGATTQSIIATTNGLYNLEVFDGLCKSYDSINVNFIAYPVVSLGNDTTYCANVPLLLDAGNPGATYLWSTGATTKFIEPATPGNYWVFAAFGNCETSDTIHIDLLLPPDVNLGNDSSLCSGDVVILDAGNTGSTFLWNDGDSSQTKTISTTGIYSVLVTNNDGCTDVDSIEFGSFGCQFNLYIPNTFTPNDDGLNEFFHAYTYNVISMDMTIFDRWGQEIFFSKDFLPGWDGTFNNVVCPEGVYIVLVNYTGEDEKGNIIKKSKKGAVRLIR